MQLMALIALLSALNPQPSTFAQGTAFTYQGRLNSGASPANGLYDFRFKLYADSLGNTQVGASYLANAIPAANGLFTVGIDFGPGIFTGSIYWLEVDVKTNNAGSYAVLSPLQQVTPTPYAVFANTASNLSGTLAAAQLSGTYSSPVAFNNAADSFSGNGTGLTNVNAATLGGLSASNFWKLAGNAGANPTNGAFLGTTDYLPLELRVNGTRALRLEPSLNDNTHSNTVNVVSGSQSNYVTPGVFGATIAGGGAGYL